MHKLAWIVGDDHPDEGRRSAVVFAVDAEQALLLGALRLGAEVEECSASRAEPYDAFAEAGEVPLERLLEDGWSFPCHQCEHPLEPGSWLREGRLLFCCPECRDQKASDVATTNAEFEEFKARIQEARPDLTWKEFQGGWPILTPVAHFTFPGALYGGGRVKAQQDGELVWMVLAGDMDAWERYNAERSK